MQSKNPLHYDDGVLHSGGDAMHVENDLRLGEGRWEPVPRLSLVYRAAAISDQFSVSIVNRNDQPAMHQPRSRVETDAKFDRRLFSDAAPGQIRVRAINAG
jgi:hypothetical protein